MWDGSIRTFSEVRRDVARLRESGLTWRAMATSPLSHISVTRMAACLCAIYKHGREPKAADIRAALGLPVTMPVAVCPRHGVVHEKRCPGAEPRPRKPTKNARRKKLIHDTRWRGLFARMVRR